MWCFMHAYLPQLLMVFKSQLLQLIRLSGLVESRSWPKGQLQRICTATARAKVHK